MIGITLSDAASAKNLSEHIARTKTALDISSTELASGVKIKLIEATAGDLGKLFAIDRTLVRLNSDKDAIQLAGGKAALAQTALESIHKSLVDFGPQLLSAVERGDVQSSKLIAGDARNALGAVISSLNTRYARHSVFAGAALDQQAVASAEVLLNDISIIVSASLDAETAISAIDDYFFNVGGGFETNIFKGSPLDAPPLRADGSEEISYSIMADSPGIRSALLSLVIAAVASNAPNFIGTSDQVDLFREAAKSAFSANDDVIKLKETIGFAEGRIEAAKAKNLTMRNVFELERASIIAIDPYDAATKFEALQVQLQTIYTITARLSGLSLTNFLR